jgi:hypothetical protein
MRYFFGHLPPSEAAAEIAPMCQACVKTITARCGHLSLTIARRSRMGSRHRSPAASCRLPRNEGVPGSSPGVGFLAYLQGVLSDQAAADTRSSTPLGAFRVRNGYVKDTFSVREVVPLPATDCHRLQGIHRRVAITCACPLVPASARASVLWPGPRLTASDIWRSARAARASAS